MKKFVTKFLTLLLSFIIILPSFTLVACKNNEPLKFTFDDYYTSEVYELPETVEATLYFEQPLNYGKYGIVLSNYDEDGPYVTICFNGKGILEVHIQTSDLILNELLFNKVAIEYKKNVHLALTFDYDNNSISCYLDGKLKQTITPKDFTLVKEQYLNPICVGGDSRFANYYSYRMGLVNLYGYKDVRTENEILDDANAKKNKFDKSDILFYYNTNSSRREKNINDLSGNDNHLTFIDHVIWVDKEPAKDYSFSFSFVGDTQVTNLYYPDELNHLYDYIAENYNKLKMKMVFGLGDITNDSTKPEYENAKANIAKLEGKVDYSIIRGNHDKISDYDRYFSYEEYGHIVDGSFDGTLKNTYKKLTIGSVKFLIITIDYGCDLDILNKINECISQNPDYNVIITTHAYLTRNGKLLKEGDFIWENLAKKYSNVVLIVSGHVTNEVILHNERIGDNGNVVHEFMIDPQEMEYQMGPTGMLTNFFFSEDGKNVEIETYSTKFKRYFMQECQMNIALDLVN